MTKITYKKTIKNNIKKLEYLLVFIIIFFCISRFAKICAPNFINIENSFIQIKIEEANPSSYNVFIAGAIFLFVMIYNFLYHQLDKAENGVIFAIGLVIGGTLANLVDIIFSGNIINYLKIGGVFTTNFATCFMIIGWIIWIGSLIMYSSMHDLKLRKIYEAQDEELKTGKNSKIEDIDKLSKKSDLKKDSTSNKKNKANRKK